MMSWLWFSLFALVVACAEVFLIYSSTYLYAQVRAKKENKDEN